ncbi:MAG: NifB/NifX family molybdenum-iron cluster-binding protein [Desulfobulbaceae bacterium]
MKSLRLAIPSNNPGGLDAERSEHFGHCDIFTVVQLDEGQVADVETISNIDHGAGGCMMPVRHLKEKAVDAIVVGGIGKRPLQGFNEVGIDVYFAHRQEYGDVRTVIDAFLQDSLPLMRSDQACTGGGDCHH